jgi:pyrroloquinoline quinone biosynthesis protein B
MTASPRPARILGPVAFWNRLRPGLSPASTLVWAVLAALPLAAEGVPDAMAEPGMGPFVLVLGTAQDGGIPHLGGRAAPDVAARRDPAHRRLVTSLLVVDPRSGKRWLLDASPDLALQLERAEAHAPLRTPEAGERRAPILDGILLTHAHVGHYLGLAQLGREIYSASALPVWGSTRMV